MPRPTSAPRLLLIDDDELLLRALSRELGSGFEVTATTSARYALRTIFDGGSFDLVLCDWYLEDMDSDDFLRCLTAIDPRQAARTVRMSGRRAPSDRWALHLEKPVRVADVSGLLVAVSQTAPALAAGSSPATVATAR